MSDPVAFPKLDRPPINEVICGFIFEPAQWFVVDLLRHTASVGLDRDDLARHLVAALRRGRFDRERLYDMADQFGTRPDRDFVRRVVREASA